METSKKIMNALCDSRD